MLLGRSAAADTPPAAAAAATCSHERPRTKATYPENMAFFWWENGFVPEAVGLSTDRLEQRIQGTIGVQCMVSRPRQPTDTGEDLLRRYDAGVRPYWLRDW